MRYETVTIVCDKCGCPLLTCVPSEVEQEWDDLATLNDYLTSGDQDYCTQCAEQIMADDDDEEE